MKDGLPSDNVVCEPVNKITQSAYAICRNLTHGHDLETISLFGCYVKVTGGQKLLGKKSYSAFLQNRIISFFNIQHLYKTKECLHLLCLLERFSLIDTLPLLRPVPSRR